tara:strand:- start:3177 stop:3377 length:201 start_codon:yes stop_codon:yes gene_type:complete
MYKVSIEHINEMSKNLNLMKEELESIIEEIDASRISPPDKILFGLQLVGIANQISKIQSLLKEYTS